MLNSEYDFSFGSIGDGDSIRLDGYHASMCTSSMTTGPGRTSTTLPNFSLVDSSTTQASTVGSVLHEDTLDCTTAVSHESLL